MEKLTKEEQEERENWKVEEAIEALTRYQKIKAEMKNKDKLKESIEKKIKSLQEIQKELN